MSRLKRTMPESHRLFRYLQEVDVVLGAVQLLEAGLLLLQLVDLLLQPFDQRLGLVERRLFIDADQLGHL